jgi:hypothetical protein
MRSKFELRWLSETQTKESTAIHIHWSVCREAKEEFAATRTNPCDYTLDRSGPHNPLDVYHQLTTALICSWSFWNVAPIRLIRETS